MKSLEIFSGAGGMAKGLESAGFEHAAFVEFNKHAYASLKVNFEPERVFCGDIRDYSFTSLSGVDLVAGGPPCQPFSLGGRHKAHQDDRDMFPHAIRAIENLQPKAFIFENVKGLLRPSFADYFAYILLRLAFPAETAKPGIDWRTHLKELKKIQHADYDGVKYQVSHRLLNAADYGVPQTRERVVIVGVRSDLKKLWRFPEPTHSAERLLWDKRVTGEYWDRHKVAKQQRGVVATSMAEKINRLRNQFGLFEPDMKPWRTIRDVLCDVPDPRSRHSIPDHLFRDLARTYPGHTGSDYDSPSKTIKAGGNGVPGGENMIRYHDGSVRYFTVFEAKRIQTFPDDYKITGAWTEAMRQIGNAVPVLLAETLGQQLLNLLVTDKHDFHNHTNRHQSRSRRGISAATSSLWGVH